MKTFTQNLELKSTKRKNLYVNHKIRIKIKNNN